MQFLLVILILFALLESLKFLKLLDLLLQCVRYRVLARVWWADVKWNWLDTWGYWAIIRSTVNGHEVGHDWIRNIVEWVVRWRVELWDRTLVMGMLALARYSWLATTWLLYIQFFVLIWFRRALWISMRPLWLRLHHADSSRGKVTLILTDAFFKLIINLVDLLQCIHLLFLLLEINEWRRYVFRMTG